MPRTEELVVITRAFDLAREMTQRTRKLPRDLKFVLGDRMLSTTYDILDTLLAAKYARQKKDLLGRANLDLERLRFQVRLCSEEQMISIRQYEYVAGLIDEVGRMVGGWAKSAREPADGG
jgi:hypothetical protein